MKSQSYSRMFWLASLRAMNLCCSSFCSLNGTLLLCFRFQIVTTFVVFLHSIRRHLRRRVLPVDPFPLYIATILPNDNSACCRILRFETPDSSETRQHKRAIAKPTQEKTKFAASQVLERGDSRNNFCYTTFNILLCR